MIQKFRVWENKNKCWLKDTDFTTYLILLDGELVKWDSGFETMSDVRDCDLEMWSTILDKNNKEIYEGDRVTNKWRNGGKPMSVIFDEGQFKVTFYCKELDATFKYPLLEELEDTEVVGNIHEADPKQKDEK